jgi:hypothetical protein
MAPLVLSVVTSWSPTALPTGFAFAAPTMCVAVLPRLQTGAAACKGPLVPRDPWGTVCPLDQLVRRISGRRDNSPR